MVVLHIQEQYHYSQMEIFFKRLRELLFAYVYLVVHLLLIRLISNYTLITNSILHLLCHLQCDNR
nr:MAG TPA: hypothetical protein [Caudoviricetes sp.]